MKVRPLGDRVIVRPKKAEEVNKSGIIIPDTAGKERQEQGEVIAVGPGKMLDNGTRSAMQVVVGNKIMFKKYGPDEVKVDGEDMLILDESDILAVIE